MPDDLRPLRALFRQAIAASRLGKREIETAMGIGHGQLERLLDGSLDLRVRHVLGLAAALKVPPKDFLDLAFPEPPGGAKLRLRDWLGPHEPAPADEKREPDLAAVVREAVREELTRGATPKDSNLAEIVRAIVREELSASNPPKRTG
jgi:transcriptional regulator with XRE-family HTH domain